MGDKIGGGGEERIKNQEDPLEESSHEDPQQQHHSIVVNTTSLISESLFNIPTIGGSSSSTAQFDDHQDDETLNPKRPKYGSGQWRKIIPSVPHQQRHKKMSPTDHHQTLAIEVPQTLQTTTGSSTPTASSPSPSPSPSQETNKPFQIRKGKFVSPVWKPNEMLWLARAWRLQYQGGGGGGGDEVVSLSTSSSQGDLVSPSTSGRGKTRAEKDREVSEFLNRHGVNRDAKTSGTKWDNMLGEFRKVYEWEKGSSDERESVGNNKSYFRLSPYERKIYKLPASFDEEVYNELSQFMGFRVRASSHQTRVAAILSGDHHNGGTSTSPPVTTNLPPLPPPPPLPHHQFKEDDQLSLSGRTKQGMEGSGTETFGHDSHEGHRGITELVGPSSSSREVRRIGRIRMTWEESVNLWAEADQGEYQQDHQYQRGRVKLQGLSFLNADELTYLDETMAGCTMEGFEEGPMKGFSIDRFVCGQQVKIFGRRKSSFSNSAGCYTDRLQLLPLTEPSIRPNPPWEYQDPTDYYIGCLKVPPSTLPSLFELSWHLQEPPSDDLRFPLRKDVYKDLPAGKELFFTTTTELLDSRAITFDILSPIIRLNPSISSSTATCRDSFISIWDDCINRVVSKFCSQEMVIVRKPSVTSSPTDNLQDQWPNVTGFVRNLCLWRGEEVDRFREGNLDPSSSIIEKILWTYVDLPYILGYYAIGCSVTFCALSRSQDRVIRTDLYSVDLTTPTDRLKSLVPCWRIAGLLPLLAERCFNNNNSKAFPYSDFERLDLGGGNLIEMTPNTVKRSFSSRRKFIAVKEIYDFLDRRIPHAEYIFRSSEKDLALTFKPRGCKLKPTTCEQLVEALKFVTKALVALHDLSFMHRDLGWDKVMKRSDRENEWFVGGFEEAVGAPQIYPNGGMVGPRHAPEMGRGLHGVKVDVWGVGQLVKTSGLAVPMLLRELQNRCLDQNPEQRPTAADCYHHLLQLQSSLCVAPGGF